MKFDTRTVLWESIEIYRLWHRYYVAHVWYLSGSFWGYQDYL